jgi:hypothetical protein
VSASYAPVDQLMAADADGLFSPAISLISSSTSQHDLSDDKGDLIPLLPVVPAHISQVSGYRQVLPV